ncbi:hypothetical protein [Colwellia maritima]|nr:hypothetical protein [Colwellia maritima]
MKVVWSPLAIEKLETTAKFIALDKPTGLINGLMMFSTEQIH